MAVRNVVAWIAVLWSIGTLAPDARAQNPVVGVDGCAILAALVYTEVSEGGLYGPGGRGGIGVYSGSDEVTICNQTARRVTTAFSAGLRQLNVYVSWGNRPADTGDYCLSHDLSQCYPRQNPLMPPLSAANARFVDRSWRAVQSAVTAHMATGTLSDVVRFERKALQRNINRSLAHAQTTLARPGSE